MQFDKIDRNKVLPIASICVTTEEVEKWSSKEENRAIQDCSQKLKEVFELWNDAQFQFAECLDELRHNFKMILEGILISTNLFAQFSE